MVSLEFSQQVNIKANRQRYPSASFVKRGKSLQGLGKPLGDSFQPGQYDVICARGLRARNHPGNRRFREIIDDHVDDYRNAKTKMDKSLIVSRIIDSIRSKSSHSGFVTTHAGKWFEAGDHIAREKIGQCFRDRLFLEYKSSSKAKRSKRTGGVCQRVEEECITTTLRAYPSDHSFEEVVVAQPDIKTDFLCSQDISKLPLAAELTLEISDSELPASVSESDQKLWKMLEEYTRSLAEHNRNSSLFLDSISPNPILS